MREEAAGADECLSKEPIFMKMAIVQKNKGNTGCGGGKGNVNLFLKKGMFSQRSATL